MIIKTYGVRGSTPTPDQQNMKFGGHTASYTIKTPANSLIFLDAGSGLRNAANKELSGEVERIFLVLSHTHADHTMGLGMSQLPYISYNPKFKNKKVSLVGPKKTLEGLTQFYSEQVWPVTPNEKEMPGLDYKVEEIEEGSLKIDEKTTMQVMRGNHPRDGVNLYRINSEKGSVVYATDCEFDYGQDKKPLEGKDALTKKYVEFIAKADVLIAEAQYTKEAYDKGAVHGWGHSYVEQIADLASLGWVKKLVVTHHDPANDDEKLLKMEKEARDYCKSKGYSLEVEFAREGLEYKL